MVKSHQNRIELVTRLGCDQALTGTLLKRISSPLLASTAPYPSGITGSTQSEDQPPKSPATLASLQNSPGKKWMEISWPQHTTRSSRFGTGGNPTPPSSSMSTPSPSCPCQIQTSGMPEAARSWMSTSTPSSGIWWPPAAPTQS